MIADVVDLVFEDAEGDHRDAIICAASLLEQLDVEQLVGIKTTGPLAAIWLSTIIRHPAGRCDPGGRREIMRIFAEASRADGFVASEIRSFAASIDRMLGGDPDALLRDANRAIERLTGFRPDAPVTPKRASTTAGIVKIPATEDNGTRWSERFIDSEFILDGKLALARWAEHWYRWNGRHFTQLDPEQLRADLHRFIERHVLIIPPKSEDNRPKEQPAHATRQRKNDVLDALQAHQTRGLPVIIDAAGETVSLPIWRAGKAARPKASDVLAVANGALDVTTGDLLPPSPDLFVLGSSSVAWNPDAECPAWLEWLEKQVADEETIQMLREFGGYCLTARNDIHRFLLLLGPPRTGKSTFARILTAVVGQSNVAAASASDLAHRFGLEVLIGKRLLIIGDARFHSRSGNAIERLLTIPGGDVIQVDRKNRTPLVYRPESKMILAANDMPMLQDASGAIARRALIARFDRSFADSEDHGVEERLLAEGEGIIRWFVTGFQQLAARANAPGGRWAYVEPASAIRAREDLIRTGSPVLSFVEDCCEVAPSLFVAKSDLFSAYQKWCDDEAGMRALSRPSVFRDLMSAIPGLTETRGRDGEGRPRIVNGIGLRLGSLDGIIRREEPDEFVDGIPV